MAKIDFRNVSISYDGYTIAPTEFGEADVMVNTGGETSEVMKGIGGGSITNVKYDKIDSVTFTLLPDSPNATRLEDYHSIVKQCEWIIKDTNPSRQRTWTSPLGQVKSYDEVALNKGDGYAFTIEFEDNLEKG